MASGVTRTLVLIHFAILYLENIVVLYNVRQDFLDFRNNIMANQTDTHTYTNTHTHMYLCLCLLSQTRIFPSM
jgi:hypothetical protein